MASSDPGRSFRLARDEELATGLARVAAGRAESAVERLRGSGAGEVDTADAVHGSRKDMKKLRTVLRLLRDPLGRKSFRRQNARFRDAARALSSTRDAEVKLETLETLAEHEQGLPEEGVEAWRGILARDREAATNAARDEPAVAEAVSLIEEGLAEIRAWEVEGDSWKLVGAALVRSYRRGRRAMKKGAASHAEADFHEWRKRAKELWYELRLLSEAWPAPLEATADEAHRLTELLGDHHDFAVLREDLRERNLGEAETVALEAAIGRRQEALAAAAFPLGRRLYAERPQDFSRRLRRYWEAWRFSEPVVGKSA
ncbi:MAG TPA: CHAD domain-containing protein [Solirubrobacterales bacterium]